MNPRVLETIAILGAVVLAIIALSGWAVLMFGWNRVFKRLEEWREKFGG
jgi:hypothetical protein